MGKVKVPALRGLSYNFKEGFTVVAGASGSGKSTLLNIVGCLDLPSEGHVYLQGNDIAEMDEAARSRLRRSHIGFIFQSFSLIPVLSVYDNTEYPILRSALSKSERKERIMRILEDVGLGEYAHRFPRELSGGQMQRVAIARALAAHPKLIIADEPTANLDSKTGEKILELLGRIQKEQGASVIIASHDGNVLERISTKLFIRDGEVCND
ncbi:MAG: hypothetical protein B0D92_04090 [Spirochaeta sp. LUC14_002_19_P3]|nr:MAG: hypothetical protein B0D92_04090 [Spirochaeta sp. LUC14_002_19_P3]